MKRIFFIIIFILTSSFANQAFDYEYKRFKGWYKTKTANEVAKYIFERAEKGLFNKLDLKTPYSYNYNYKDNKFIFKMKVDENKKYTTTEFRNAVEKLVCQEPLLSAAIYTELKMEFSLWNPYINFTHYKFGLNKNSEPLCIGHRKNIKKVDTYWNK
ncbi:MAG: hypothetical protein IJ211_06785 [Campylobacter sp.]|nr:hypothetical protein [Campylobacter sp.]